MVSHARWLAEAFPYSELHIINGSATYVMLDQPPLLAAAVRNFTKHT